MRRAAKGGTTHPPLGRPGYGYGRPLRPRPEQRAEGRPWLEPRWWVTATEAAAEPDRGAVAERS
jgi:hypothetical protein